MVSAILFWLIALWFIAEFEEKRLILGYCINTVGHPVVELTCKVIYYPCDIGGCDQFSWSAHLDLFTANPLPAFFPSVDGGDPHGIIMSHQ